jgi:hypothetical protein
MALLDLACNARRLHHVVERFVVPIYACIIFACIKEPYKHACMHGAAAADDDDLNSSF